MALRKRGLTSTSGEPIACEAQRVADKENQIADWRAYVHGRRELHHTDAEELEDVPSSPGSGQRGQSTSSAMC